MATTPPEFTLLLLLPLELVANVVDQFSDGGQAAAFSQCSRLTHQLTFDKVFDLKFHKESLPSFDDIFNEGSLLHSFHDAFNELFHHAAETDSVRIVDWLLSHELGYLLKEASHSLHYDDSYLSHALIDDAPKVTTHLLRLGYSDYATEDCCTPLYLALCRHNHIFSHDLDEPLRLAATFNLLRTMRVLLRRGANPNAIGKCGVTAFHIVIQLSICRSEDKLRKSRSLLLDFGADVNLQTESCGVQSPVEDNGWHRHCQNPNEGKTALHIAARTNREEVTSFLLENGANPHMRDGEGCTPLWDAMSAA
ncbi:hypothetical protein FALBO_12807 [Fusarium albosuccineum]|uniref:Ankyrin repeat protein n=1 Tax=Fusarium albosuccineum TaxID=1237068 RepID=A0A8H4P7N2_9HYPO|nr:hypothetical protein FALBO_12807 [Fusarium albosuccineum]